MPKKSLRKQTPRISSPATMVATAGSGEASGGVLARLIHHAAGVQEKAVERLLRPEGATRIQVGVLQHASKAGVPMGKIAERLGCHVSNLTGVVDRMQRQGLVRRHRAPRDRGLSILLSRTAIWSISAKFNLGMLVFHSLQEATRTL